MQKRLPIFLSFFLLSLLMSACNLPTTTPTEPMDVIRTYAAQTMQAIGTEIANTNVPVFTPTPTLQPSETPGPTVTPLPPTNTPMPSFTPTATTVCDKALFIRETVPDSTDFFPGSVFTKSWTIKNAGSCTWNSNYAVILTGGSSALNAPASQAITTGTVAPGETVVISMTLTAPVNPGTYKTEFKLRNASNVIFGTGDSGREFWIEIDVVQNKLNLASNYCSAEWSTESGKLPCPGKDGDSNGFVYLDKSPILETGYHEDEPTLWTGPENTNNGYIKAIFPAQKIPADMVFKVLIGCAPKNKNCNVIMSLSYKEPGGSVKPLDTWSQTYDNYMNKVTFDLTDLAGKNIQLILMVDANGSATGDKVHWVAPRIEPWEVVLP